jgi:hypothetical protein
MFHVKHNNPFYGQNGQKHPKQGNCIIPAEIIQQNKQAEAASITLDSLAFQERSTLKSSILRSFSMRFLKTVLFFLFPLISFGQLEPVAIGDWKIQMPLNSAKDVTKANQIVYTAFTNGLLVYDLEDESKIQLSKANGLSSIHIAQVEFESNSGTVLVGYSDGNLDIINPDKSIINMSDIQRSNITGDKSIYNIVIINNLAYICTGFGIVVFDPSRLEFKDTYIFGTGGTNIKVNAVCSDGTSIYAATDIGLYSALLSNPFLSNYTSWTKDLSLNPAAQNGPFSNCAFHGSKLFVSREITGNNNDSAYYFDGTWNDFLPSNGNDVVKLKSIGNRLAFIGNGFIYHYDVSMTKIAEIFTYTFGYIDAVDTDFDPATNYIYLADKRFGLTNGANSYNNSKHSPSSPYSTGSVHVAASAGSIWIAHDGFAGVNGLNGYSKFYFSGTYDNNWLNFNQDTQPTTILADSVFDVVSVCIDPRDENHVFVGTFSYKGLFEMQDGAVIGVWDEINSAISNAGIAGYNSISAMDFDEDDNLWMINAKSTEPLVVKKADATWQRFDLGSSMKNRNILDVEAGKSGFVWIAAPTGNSTGGLMVYDFNETIDDLTDDQSYLYSIGSGRNMGWNR